MTMTIALARLTDGLRLTASAGHQLRTRARRLAADAAAELDRSLEALLLGHPQIAAGWLREDLPERAGEPDAVGDARALPPALVLRLRTMRRQERRFCRRREATVALVDRTLQTAATCLFTEYGDLQVICFSERNTEYSDEGFEPGFEVLGAVVGGAVVEQHPALEVFTHVLDTVGVLYDCCAGLENLLIVRRDASGAVGVEDLGFQESFEDILEDLANDPACVI